VVIPAMPVRWANAVPPEVPVLPVQPEKRANLAVMDNLEALVWADQWENVVLPVCLDFPEPKDTEACPERMEPRDLRDNKDSQEISESLVPSDCPVQWVPAAPAANVVVSGPRDLPDSAVATVFPAREVLPVPSDPRVPPASPASPDPRETKDNKAPKEAAVFKDPAERTDFRDLRENRVSKVAPVWTVPTERKDPAETWDPKEPRASRDREDPPARLVTPEWLVRRVFRDNLEFLDFVD